VNPVHVIDVEDGEEKEWKDSDLEGKEKDDDDEM